MVKTRTIPYMYTHIHLIHIAIWLLLIYNSYSFTEITLKPYEQLDINVSDAPVSFTPKKFVSGRLDKA